VVELLKLVKKQ